MSDHTKPSTLADAALDGITGAGTIPLEDATIAPIRSVELAKGHGKGVYPLAHPEPVETAVSEKAAVGRGVRAGSRG